MYLIQYKFNILEIFCHSSAPLRLSFSLPLLIFWLPTIHIWRDRKCQIGSIITELTIEVCYDGTKLKETLRCLSETALHHATCVEFKCEWLSPTSTMNEGGDVVSKVSCES